MGLGSIFIFTAFTAFTAEPLFPAPEPASTAAPAPDFSAIDFRGSLAPTGMRHACDMGKNRQCLRA